MGGIIHLVLSIFAEREDDWKCEIVGSILEVEVGCKEGSIIGSDEELCDGSLDDK